MFQVKQPLPSRGGYHAVPILFPGNRWAFEAGGVGGGTSHPSESCQPAFPG